MYKTCVQFFTDGYDSAAQVFGVLLYYLTVNQDVQERLQADIDDLFESKGPGEDINQNEVNDMKYLDQVICEGQRLGCFAYTARMCNKDWQVPGDRFVIPKDTRVYIPIVSYHSLPPCLNSKVRLDFTTTRSTFPTRRSLTPTGLRIKEPSTAAPSRPLAVDQGGSINTVILTLYSNILSSRQCLGKSLYVIESKVLLIHLLRNFRFEKSKF